MSIVHVRYPIYTFLSKTRMSLENGLPTFFARFISDVAKGNTENRQKQNDQPENRILNKIYKRSATQAAGVRLDHRQHKKIDG
jgi:hypothetical protein